MAQSAVKIRTLANTSVAVGAAGARIVAIDRSKEAGGEGMGFNRGDLPLLAIGEGSSNDAFREAGDRGMFVHAVEVQVTADCGGEPVRAQKVAFSFKVDADASEADMLDLIRHTDRVAEIPNSRRPGTEVKLANAEAVSRS